MPMPIEYADKSLTTLREQVPDDLDAALAALRQVQPGLLDGFELNTGSAFTRMDGRWTPISAVLIIQPTWQGRDDLPPLHGLVRDDGFVSFSCGDEGELLQVNLFAGTPDQRQGRVATVLRCYLRSVFPLVTLPSVAEAFALSRPTPVQ